MGDDRVERRAIIGVGAGLLAALAGCGGLFIEPEPTSTPPGGEGPSATPTASPTATVTATPPPTDTPTRTPTRTATPMPSEVIAVRNRRLTVERTRLEKFALVTYRFDVENAGDRTIRDVEFRIRVRYEHEDYSRIVAVDYPRFRFDDDDGLETDESERVIGDIRFERDGRAQESTARDRFDLELTVRRIRYG
ncbi:MAG: hypothetical protein V5A16_03945 [Haloplanus sp.]